MQSPLAVRATLRTLRQRADADLARAVREADAQAELRLRRHAAGLALCARTPSFEGAFRAYADEWKDAVCCRLGWKPRTRLIRHHQAC